LELDDQKTRDSIWNFHVWNDAWMARVDLGAQYFGWQAIDATPQETSEGLYQTGPAPLIAIKEGTKDVNYDLEFIYAEVNADENYYVEGDDGYKLVRTITDSVGVSMSTKAVGSTNRHDVTGEYKYAEGSIEERASHGATDTKSGDVTIRWEVDDNATLGSTVAAKLTLETTQGLTRNAQVDLVAAVTQYTGKHRKTIQQQHTSVVLQGGTPVVLDFSLPSSAYQNTLYGDNSFSFKAFVQVQETGQISMLFREFDFKSYELQINVPTDKVTVGSIPTATIIFTNKLAIPLTNLLLTVDGQGLTNLQKFTFATLQVGETLTQQVALNVTQKGKHLLIADLHATEVSDIDGHKEIIVE